EVADQAADQGQGQDGERGDGGKAGAPVRDRRQPGRPGLAQRRAPDRVVDGEQERPGAGPGGEGGDGGPAGRPGRGPALTPTGQRYRQRSDALTAAQYRRPRAPSHEMAMRFLSSAASRRRG